jgi:hypothetical protein
MAINIKDDATDALARELAQRTGETLTAAVRRAIEERLERVRGAISPRNWTRSDNGVARCRSSMTGRRTRSWDTTTSVCRADGHRHLGPPGHPL